jgi:hypothetical protein
MVDTAVANPASACCPQPTNKTDIKKASKTAANKVVCENGFPCIFSSHPKSLNDCFNPGD